MMIVEVSDPRLQRLLEYWSQKKGERRAPGRPDIHPEEIPDILPWLLLMERVESRIRYRLVGDGFRQIYGDKLAGLYLDEIDLDHITAAYIEEYDRAARYVLPVARKWAFTRLSGRTLEYERLILPLSPDGETVNMFLTGAVGFGFG